MGGRCGAMFWACAWSAVFAMGRPVGVVVPWMQVGWAGGRRGQHGGGRAESPQQCKVLRYLLNQRALSHAEAHTGRAHLCSRGVGWGGQERAGKLSRLQGRRFAG